MRALLASSLLLLIAAPTVAQMPVAPSEAAAESEVEATAEPVAEALPGVATEATPVDAPVADTTPAPATTPPTTPAPTNTVGPSLVVAAPSETPTPAGEPQFADDEPEGVPWNFSVGWNQGYNAAGIDRGVQASFNPEYAWGFDLVFGWLFADSGLAFSWTQSFGVELTDSDSTVTRQELVLSDMTLGLAYPRTFELAKDRRWVLTPSLGLIAPTSNASMAAGLIVGTGAGLGASYTYDAWLEGFTLGSDLSYTRRWATSNVVATEVPFFCQPVGAPASRNCVHQAGATTGRDAFNLSFSVASQITKELSASASIAFGWTLAHDLAAVNRAIDSGSTLSFGDDETHLRTTRSIGFDLGYAFLPWLSSSVYVSNGFGELGPDGQVRGPFEAVDTTIGTTVVLSVDQLHAGSSGDGARSD